MAMTVEQFLLLKLQEECAEVAQRASKQMQFGPDEIQTGQLLTNKQRLLMEVNDLTAVLELLEAADQLPIQSGRELTAAVETKRLKIKKYLEYSQSLGKVGA